MLDPRCRLLLAALGFAGLSMPSYDRALHGLRTWLGSWAGIGRIAVGMARQGYDLQLTRYDARGWRDVLRERYRAQPNQRDGHGLGTDAVARDTARGVGGAEEGRRRWLNRGPRSASSMIRGARGCLCRHRRQNRLLPPRPVYSRCSSRSAIDSSMRLANGRLSAGPT